MDRFKVEIEKQVPMEEEAIEAIEVVIKSANKVGISTGNIFRQITQPLSSAERNWLQPSWSRCGASRAFHQIAY